MALATRCPNCNALFRVAAEQLRSRSGMVRCGACRQVFNAIAGLDYLDAQRFATDDTGPRSVPAPPEALAQKPHNPAGPVAAGAAAQLAPPAMPAPARAAAQSAAAAGASTSQSSLRSAQQPEPQSAAAAVVPSVEPAARRLAPVPKPAPAVAVAAAPQPAQAQVAATDRRRNPRSDSVAPAPEFAPAANAVPPNGGVRITAAESAEVEQGAALDTLFIVPADEATGGGEATTGTGEAELVSAAEPAQTALGPSFLQETRPGPIARGVLVAGSGLLIPLLAAQLALIFRTPLVVAFPTLRPALQALCTPLACTASWPMRPDLLAVVSSELQAVPGTSILELDTVLRNRAAFALALPAIELTVSDNNGRAVARKVFLPSEYRDPATDAGTDPTAGNIAAGGDLAVRVYFDLPGISATNFEAYPFYP